MNDLCEAEFWNLNITWYTDTPQFTTCFKETVLVWIPCAFLWVLLPMQIYYLRNSQYRDIPWNYFNVIKLSLITITTVILLLIIIMHSPFFTNVEPKIYNYSTAINFLTEILFLILTYYGVKMGISSSGILVTFCFLNVICGFPNFLISIANWNSSIINEANIKSLSYILIYSCDILIFVMNCFADKTPRLTLCPIEENMKPTKNVSFLSNAFLTWMDPYFWKNYKNPINKITWNYYYKDDGTKNLLSTRDKNSEDISVLKLLHENYGFNFWYCNFLYIIHEAIGVGLFVIYWFLLTAIYTKQPTWKCYAHMVTFFAMAMMQVVIISYYWNWCFKLEIRVKNAMTKTLYEKFLRVSSQTRTEYTTSDIVSIISMDVNQLLSIFRNVNSLIGMLIQIILIFLFLWFLLDASVSISIIFFILLMVTSYCASIYLKKLQRKEVQHKDIRNRFMQEIFTAIKVVKMYAWEYSFKSIAENQRKNEENDLKHIGFIFILFQTILMMSPVLLFIISYTGRVLLNPEVLLGTVEAFMVMAINFALRTSLYMFPQQCISIQQGSIAIQRINKFLSTEELDCDTISHDSTVQPALLMKQASFSWVSKNGPTILQNLDIEIENGELVAIVGTVGTGKSSFISACLGEMYKMSGYVNIKGSIAYVPQQAWILNRTFKENVTLNVEINKDLCLYEKALKACALESDINTFPGRDSTEIGEKGMNLSGGQKQRVSLARAIYQNADVYFFDDPLSALDSRVTNHIFHNVIGPKSILKEKTRILVTHSAKYFPFVDRIILLKNGRISEIGTYEELLIKNEDFAEFVSVNLANSEHQKDNECPRFVGNSCSTKSVDQDRKKDRIHTSSVDSKEKDKSVKNSNSHIISKENVQTHQIYAKFFHSYITLAGMCSSVIMFILLANGQIFLTLNNVWIAIWYIREDPQKNVHIFILVCIGLALTIGLSITFGYINLFTKILKVSSNLHEKLLDSVLHWPMSLFDAIPVGRIMSRFGDDLYTLDNFIGFNLSQNLTVFYRFSIMILALTAVISEVIFILIPFILLFYGIRTLFAPMFLRMKRIEAIHRSSLYSHLVETVEGIQSIRAYQFEKKFATLTQQKNHLWSSAYYSSSLCTNWLSNRCAIAGALFYLIFIALSIHKKDSVNFGFITITLTFGFEMLKGIGIAILQLSNLEDNILSMERIEQYIKQPQESTWNDLSEHVDEKWPQKGVIVFKDYQLQYRTGLEYVLKGINFRINSGEKVGIIGRTGAGKSSLFLGLFRIVEPAGGTILIDGVDITKLGLHTLRSKLTVIPQDPVLFSGTLRFNLDPFEKHGDDRLWNVLEKSHLKPYVNDLSEGLDFVVEEGGKNLSFGQRQLICLARALLRKTKILVLDEATASVDMKTDELIQKTIRSEFADCTILTIAHRLNTLQNYDKIMVLDGGKLVQYGTLKSLNESENSLFRDMVQEEIL